MLVVIRAPIFPKPPVVIGHCSSPLAGTSTSRAEIINAGPPGVSWRSRFARESHFCVSGADSGALGALGAITEAGKIQQSAAMKPIRLIRDDNLLRLGRETPFSGASRSRNRRSIHYSPAPSCGEMGYMRMERSLAFRMAPMIPKSTDVWRELWTDDEQAGSNLKKSRSRHYFRLAVY